PLQALQLKVSALHAEFTNGTAFDHLGVHWSHPPSGLAQAYLTRQAQLREMQSQTANRASQQLQAMQSQLEQSYRLLQNKLERQKYRQQFIDAGQVAHVTQMLFQKAQMLMMRNSFREAREALESCVELEPDNRAFRELLQKAGGVVK